MTVAHAQLPFPSYTENGPASYSKAFTSSVGAGSLLWCFTWQYSAASTCTSVTDTLGGTWTKAQTEIRQGVTNGTITGWYKPNTGAGACTVTATWSAAGRGGIMVGEVTGLAGGGELDQAIANNVYTGGSGKITAGTFATFAQAAQALIAFTINSAGGTPSGAWTAGTQLSSYDYERSMYQVTAATTAQEAYWTTGSSTNLAAAAMAFKDAAGGDTTPPTLSSPVGTATGSSTATVGATTAGDANGTMYAIVSTSATPPSEGQIQAGQTNAGVAAIWSGNQAITTTGAKTFSATGLAASTLYYAHIQHRDAAGNDSTVWTSASFTTSAVASATRGASPSSPAHLGRMTYGIRR